MGNILLITETAALWGEEGKELTSFHSFLKATPEELQKAKIALLNLSKESKGRPLKVLFDTADFLFAFYELPLLKKKDLRAILRKKQKELTGTACFQGTFSCQEDKQIYGEVFALEQSALTEWQGLFAQFPQPIVMVSFLSAVLVQEAIAAYYEQVSSENRVGWKVIYFEAPFLQPRLLLLKGQSILLIKPIGAGDNTERELQGMFLYAQRRQRGEKKDIALLVCCPGKAVFSLDWKQVINFSVAFNLITLPRSFQVHSYQQEKILFQLHQSAKKILLVLGVLISLSIFGFGYFEGLLLEKEKAWIAFQSTLVKPKAFRSFAINKLGLDLVKKAEEESFKEFWRQLAVLCKEDLSLQWVEGRFITPEKAEITLSFSSQQDIKTLIEKKLNVKKLQIKNLPTWLDTTKSYQRSTQEQELSSKAYFSFELSLFDKKP